MRWPQKEGVKRVQVRTPWWPGDAPLLPINQAIMKFWVQMIFHSMRKNKLGAPSRWRYMRGLSACPPAVPTPISVGSRRFLPRSPSQIALPCYPKRLRVCRNYSVTSYIICYAYFHTHEWNTPHYFQFKTHLFFHIFKNWNLACALNSKHCFPLFQSL